MAWLSSLLCVKIRYPLFSVQPMPEVFVKTSFADKRLPVVVCGVKIKRRSAFVDFSADTTETSLVCSIFVATCYYFWTIHVISLKNRITSGSTRIAQTAAQPVTLVVRHPIDPHRPLPKLQFARIVQVPIHPYHARESALPTAVQSPKPWSL